MLEFNKIYEHYEKEKSSKLLPIEYINIQKYFGINNICITNEEVIKCKLYVDCALEDLFNNKLPPFEIFKYKVPIPEKSLQDLYLQALIDYKNDKISLLVINYIENYINERLDRK